jgi:hypothetical protein
LLIQGGNVSGRPAVIRERDVKAVIRAARKAGGTEVELRLGGSVSAVIRLAVDNEATADDPSDNNNSFDKIMKKRDD